MCFRFFAEQVIAWCREPCIASMRTSCKGLVLRAHTLLPLSSIKQNIVCSVQSFIYRVSRTQLPLLHTALRNICAVCSSGSQKIGVVLNACAAEPFDRADYQSVLIDSLGKAQPRNEGYHRSVSLFCFMLPALTLFLAVKHCA